MKKLSQRLAEMSTPENLTAMTEQMVREFCKAQQIPYSPEFMKLDGAEQTTMNLSCQTIFLLRLLDEEFERREQWELRVEAVVTALASKGMPLNMPPLFPKREA